MATDAKTDASGFDKLHRMRCYALAVPLLFAMLAGCGNEPANSPQGGPGANNDDAPVTAAGVRWVGRVDAGDPAAPRFAWSGSGFVATVSGTSVSVRRKTEGTSEPVFFQPLIDGSPGERFSLASDDTPRA